MKQLMAFTMFFFFSLSASTETDFFGQAEMLGVGYTEGNDEHLFGEIRFLPEFNWYQDQWSFYLQGDLRIDSQSYATGLIDDDFITEEERWLASLRQAYVEYLDGPWEIRLGQQVFNWSKTEIVSPSDFSPRDWTNVIWWERVGQPALDIHWGYNTFAEVVIMPWHTPSRLPQGRWSQRELPLSLAYGDTNPSQGNMQVAVRIGARLSGWDLEAGYFYGYSNSPGVELAPTTVGFQIIPTYRRQSVWTISAVGELGNGIIYKSEVGYFDQDDDDDFVQAVVGLQRTWNDLFQDTDEFTALVQYVDEIETHDVSPEQFRTADFRRGFNQALMGRLEYYLNDAHTWKLKVEGSYNLGDQDSLFQPSVTWYNGDNLEVELSYYCIQGHQNTFWGGWGDDDGVYIKATLFF